MIVNELHLNAAGDAYVLHEEFRARRDERAYQILSNAAAYVIIAHAAGQYPIEVVKAVQIDCAVAQMAIDVARREV
jgi:hypothetical protein